MCPALEFTAARYFPCRWSLPDEMSYQIEPSASDSQYFCIPSRAVTYLDLNLSQKTCQNSFRGVDEADCSHPNVAQANMNRQEENRQGLSNMTTTLNENADSTLTNNCNQQSLIRLEYPGSEPGKATLEKPIQRLKNKRGASSGSKQKIPKINEASISETKRVVMALGANNDDIVEKSPRRIFQKSKHPSIELPKRKLSETPSPKNNSSLDIVERRLLLDERKIRLAEQRFALEEKKLEATIEIGKGLIISMERMNRTISTLGVSAAHQ